MHRKWHFKRARAALVVGLTIAAGVGAFAPPAAHALDFDAGYCPATSATGHVSYTPGVTVTPSPNTFTMDVSCSAAGTADESGSYALTLNGTSLLDTCASGTDDPSGSGTVTGTGPEGAVSGTFSFTKPGIHYYIDGEYTSGAERHTLKLWLDIINQSPSPCFYNEADLIGHGVFADQVTPQDGIGGAAFLFLGNGFFSPPVSPTFTANDNVAFSGTALGQFDAATGSCTVAFSGAGADSLLQGAGTGTGNCAGTGIAITCSANYTRVGAQVAIAGVCSGTATGSLSAVAELVPTSLSPMSSFALVGTGAIT